MARGVSCDDGGSGGDIVDCGGGGCSSGAGSSCSGGDCTSSVCAKRFSSPYGSWVAASSFADTSTKTSSENDRRDVFFGMDDIEETRDLLYKEDLLECYRRESALKSLRKAQKRSSSIIRCFEFLKLLCCINRPRR